MYVFGGVTEAGETDDLLTFSAQGANLTTTSNSAPPPRQAHSALVSGLYMIIFGGFNTLNGSAVYFNTVEVFDFSNSTWVSIGTPANNYRSNHVAFMSSNYLFVHGGLDQNQNSLSNFEVLELNVEELPGLIPPFSLPPIPGIAPSGSNSFATGFDAHTSII